MSSDKLIKDRFAARHEQTILHTTYTFDCCVDCLSFVVDLNTFSVRIIKTDMYNKKNCRYTWVLEEKIFSPKLLFV